MKTIKIVNVKWLANFILVPVEPPHNKFFKAGYLDELMRFDERIVTLGQTWK